MIYYIFRHGETFRTKSGIPYTSESIINAPIIEEGVPALRRMGKFLKDFPSDYQVRSEFLRCRQTTEVISSVTGEKFVEDARLNEHLPDEPFEKLHERIVDFLKDIEEKKIDSVKICTHGDVVAGLKFLLTTGEFKKEQSKMFPRPGVLFVITDGKLEEHDFNQE